MSVVVSFICQCLNYMILKMRRKNIAKDKKKGFVSYFGERVSGVFGCTWDSSTMLGGSKLH